MSSIKLKIDNDQLAEDFFQDTLLLGIVAPIKDYTLTWHINQVLGFQFRINHSIEIQLKKKNRTYYFPIYEYLIPTISTAHYLYNNHHDGEYLLPEFKHLDFLWLVKSEELDRDAFKLLQQTIRTIPSIQLVTEMTNEKIKNKQHLFI